MNRNLLLAFTMLLFAGILAPAYAQTTHSVVINEVDINPPGDDSASIAEWVELYNPTDSNVDISGWKIASTTILKKTLTIPVGTIIAPEQLLTYSYQTVWFTDANESVELWDANNILIDKTPPITDIKNDFTTWQRLYDGYDSDSEDDWKFVTATIGSSNGKLIQTAIDEEITVTVSSTKPSYVFGEVATIEGRVSEEIPTVRPYFTPIQILITISGPNLDTTIPLYPDLNLSYRTTLNLNKVLGIAEGVYNITVRYGDATAQTSFSVGSEIFEQVIKVEQPIRITSDKPQYIPGQIVSITGFATEIIPFVGMKFTVTDSEDNLVTNGNLYPTDGQFKTSFYISNIDPTYGTYNILAEYSDKSASASFKVVEDTKEDVPISLWTDKVAYSVGDEVKITGRLNEVWTSTLDLEILQTKQSALGLSSGVSDAGFKILDGVRITGDGFFSYDFIIPNHTNRLGDYKINISKDIGSASVIIHAVEDPDDFALSDDPLTLFSDKKTYEIGETLVLNGFIKDPFVNSSYKTGSVVNIDILHEDGTPLKIVALSAQNNANDGESFNYDFTAVPESSGNYMIEIDLYTNIFSTGNYIIKSQYLGHIVRETFTITDPLDLTDGAVISLDKEVYGLGETVHLTGIVPPTAVRSVDISITKPDGTVTTSGTSIDDQRFSWSWTTPLTESFQYSNPDSAERSVSKSNFGIYKMSVSIDSLTENIFFKVSEDPENDSISTNPLFVSTEKSLYKVGEKLKVIGNVIEPKQDGDDFVQAPPRVTIKVLDGSFPYKLIHESTVYPATGGKFSSSFELPVTVFSEGPYTVKASYLGITDRASFSVANDFNFGLDEDIALLVSTDKSEYHPGDVVTISGKPNKLIYLEKFDISVGKATDSDITCGSFICGDHVGPVMVIHPSSSGAFTHEFTIPDLASAVGTYKVTVDANFEKKSIQFTVIDKPQNSKQNTIIEKVNRISEKTISVLTETKTIDGVTISPRVLTGSLVTPSKGDESSVDLRVSSVTGICIIGPDADCLVRESTRKQGFIYDVVDVDGTSLYVRYSGPDVRLEKFSILPESPVAFLSDTTWNVEVVKDDQVSRFYYKVTYKTLE